MYSSSLQNTLNAINLDTLLVNKFLDYTRYKGSTTLIKKVELLENTLYYTVSLFMFTLAVVNIALAVMESIKESFWTRRALVNN